MLSSLLLLVNATIPHRNAMDSHPHSAALIPAREKLHEQLTPAQRYLLPRGLSEDAPELAATRRRSPSHLPLQLFLMQLRPLAGSSSDPPPCCMPICNNSTQQPTGTKQVGLQLRPRWWLPPSRRRRRLAPPCSSKTKSRNKNSNTWLKQKTKPVPAKINTGSSKQSSATKSLVIC